MKTIIFGVCCLILLFCSTVQTAFACTCIADENKKVNYKRWLKKFNGAVFSGRVIDVEWRSGLEIKVAFEVERYWKGVTTSEIIIYTEATTCGYHYEKGDRYFVVAANSKNNKLRTGVCTELEYSQSEERFVKELGEGKKLEANKANP